MNISRRVAVSFLVAAIALFVGMLFWPFILNNIIRPTALVVWLLLRILVLSVEQKYFWYGVSFVAVIFLFRLLRREPSVIQQDVYLATNATIKKIGYWRSLFTYNGENVQEEESLKRELIYLLTSFYASKQSTSNHLGLYDALQKGEIPLPGHIHTFLFSKEPQKSGGPIKKVFQFIRNTPRKRIRQWTGQEKAEQDRMIDEVLHFLETSLEIKNDERNLIQN